jgi:hypothetical protein
VPNSWPALPTICAPATGELRASTTVPEIVPCCARPGGDGRNQSNAESIRAVRSKAAKIRGSNYRIIRYLPPSGLSSGYACLGYGMVIFARASAHADGAYDLAVTLNWNPTGEDHNLAVVRSVNTEELLSRLRVLA